MIKYKTENFYGVKLRFATCYIKRTKTDKQKMYWNIATWNVRTIKIKTGKGNQERKQRGNCRDVFEKAKAHQGLEKLLKKNLLHEREFQSFKFIFLNFLESKIAKLRRSRKSIIKLSRIRTLFPNKLQKLNAKL